LANMLSSCRFAAVLVISLSIQSISGSECARHRLPWYHLSNEEQLLFVDGYQTLKTDGTLDIFIESHRTVSTNDDIHHSSQNFFWHSYWLWELESAFRGLGGDYECFALPYWDVTVDGELWLRNLGGRGELGREPEIDDLPIYDSNMGGDGDIDNNMCVGGLWSTDHYVTDMLCADDEEADNCCLKRLHITSNDSRLFSRANFTRTIVKSEYERFGDFLNGILVMHGDIHRFIGSVPYTHFYASDGSSVETGTVDGETTSDPGSDPLFILFHSFLDYVRLLRTDCWNFDKVALDDLDQYMNYSFETMDTSLDYEMNFKEICTDLDTFCADHTVTPRLMYDESANTRWNVVYELGGFWNQNAELVAECADDLNISWWANTMTGQRDITGKEARLAVVDHSDIRSITDNLKVIAVVFVGILTLAPLLALYYLLRNLIAEKAQSAYQCVD